jgi:glycosyltransferase involved in cell wall biosynthesis
VIAPQAVAELFAATDLHVCPTRPYVVSRSMLDSMAAGCVVLASDIEPVREFINHGDTGLLVSANDPESWQRLARAVLNDPGSFRPMGDRAAAFVRANLAREVTLPRLSRLLRQLALA